MNIGTNTGAIRAHFADAEPMNRLMNAAKRTNKIMVGIVPIPEFLKNSAPFNARIVPNLV